MGDNFIIFLIVLFICYVLFQFIKCTDENITDLCNNTNEIKKDIKTLIEVIEKMKKGE